MSFIEKPHAEVPTLDSKAGNHGGNLSKTVPAISNENENKGLVKQGVWLTVKEAGKLLGITDRAMKNTSPRWLTGTVASNIEYFSPRCRKKHR